MAYVVMPDQFSIAVCLMFGFYIHKFLRFQSSSDRHNGQKRTLIKCRLIKGRRYRHRRVHRQCRGRPCRFKHVFVYLLRMMFVLSVVYAWSLHPSMHNKLMHILNGNGGAPSPTKGRGRGKGGFKGKAKSYAAANSPPAQPFQNVDSPQQLTDMYAIVKSHDEVQKDQEFRAKMKEALPTAAWAHSVPTLVDEEWNIRTCLYNELGPSGGVAYVRKDQVIAVVSRVGYTQAPCAIVTSQTAQELGMPYMSVPVRCSLAVQTEDGSREVVEVAKFLTQLGFGPKVSRAVSGPLVQAPCTMTKVTIKFDTATGLEPSDLTGKTVATALSKHIQDGLFLDINVRRDLTATVMVQDAVLDQLMQGSGYEHIYYKVHINEPLADRYEVLWLSDDTSHEDALQLNTTEKSFGLAMKRTAAGPRYGVRFLTLEAMDAFATKYKLGAKHKLGRFRLTGVPSSVGVKGVHDMLHPYGWTVEEVEYAGEESITFLSSKLGTVTKMHWKDHRGNMKPVHIKALNSAAKRMTASASQASHAEKSFASGSQRSDAQKALFNKRPEANQTKTNMTPPPKQPRTENPS